LDVIVGKEASSRDKPPQQDSVGKGEFSFRGRGWCHFFKDRLMTNVFSQKPFNLPVGFGGKRGIRAKLDRLGLTPVSQTGGRPPKPDLRRHTYDWGSG